MDYRKEYENWLKNDELDKSLKAELIKMSDNDDLLKDAFGEHLSFGTGGLRGVMGAGLNRMNIYTVRRATKGIADYIIEKKMIKKFVITHDTRNNSRLFAMEAAKVLVANGITVYLTEGPRPTPFLSYLVRYYKAGAGINITASHNTKEYNGYKFYLSDGAQASYPDDENVIKYVNRITDIFSVKVVSDKELTKSKLFNKVEKKAEESFSKDALSKIINKSFVSKYGKELKVVYTPMHGVGSFFLIDLFKKAGFKNVSVVTSQDDKCGDFKTVASPNPEKPEALAEAVKLAKKVDADIIIATDPDADRLGCEIRIKKGEYKYITGNQLGSVLLQYIIYFAKKNGAKMSESYVVKSFVTTRILDDICKRYGAELITTLTGFKWIGREIEARQKKKNFIFATEESIGYLVSDYCRDKDSIGAALVVLEMALAYKKILGLTVYDILNMIYDSYGARANRGESIEFTGLDGKAKMKEVMDKLRKEPITHITDLQVKKIEDYEKGVAGFAKNDTLKIYLSDDSVISIRPSGTEPKVKMYYDCVDESIELAENKIDILSRAINKIIKGE